MRAEEASNRISLANEALFRVGSNVFLGSAWGKDGSQFLDSDGSLFEFAPFEQFGETDDD